MQGTNQRKLTAFFVCCPIMHINIHFCNDSIWLALGGQRGVGGEVKRGSKAGGGGDSGASVDIDELLMSLVQYRRSPSSQLQEDPGAPDLGFTVHVQLQ